MLDISRNVLYHANRCHRLCLLGLQRSRTAKQRHLGFHWLPGAIMTEYVSTNGRTFARPPDSWNIGAWGDPKANFAGTPQSLTADYIHDGVTGASGHVYEPYLAIHAASEHSAAGLLSRPQSCRELLSCDSGAELDEHRGRRSAVQSGKAVMRQRSRPLAHERLKSYDQPLPLVTARYRRSSKIAALPSRDQRERSDADGFATRCSSARSTEQFEGEETRN